MDNCVLIDWFSMTCKHLSHKEAIEMLHLRDDIEFTESYGRYGYKNRLFFDGISIHYNHFKEDQNEVLIEMSGQGCRDFETYSSIDWDYLFSCALDYENFTITRIDVAYDDHNGLLDITKIVSDTEDRNFVSKWKNGIITNSFKGEKTNAYSVMFGSRSSDLYMRIYDKAKERSFHNRHWVRCEVVYKHDRAYEFLFNSAPIGVKLRGSIHNYLRFVTPEDTDVNKSRWKMRKYWSKFLNNVEPISLYTKKTVDYNLSRLGNFVFKQAGNSIDTYIKCQGLIKFLGELLKRETRLNAHQRDLIRQYVAQMQDNEPFNSEEFIDRIGGVYKL